MAERLKRLSRENLRMKRGAVVFGDVLYRPGGICGPRTQHDFQLVVIHQGCLNLKLDQEDIFVPEGQGILLSPQHREHFQFSPTQETHHSWCAIEPRAVPPSIRILFQQFRGPAPVVGRMNHILNIGRAMLFPSREEELENAFYLGLALAVMSDFAMAVRNGKIIVSPADSVLARMNLFISDHYRKPVTLDNIARSAGVSKQHLLKLCRANGKTTPVQQLYNKRLEAAAELLLNTGFSISEIADRCGFVNAFHFSRKFKEAYGRSPSAWRDTVWKSQKNIPGGIAQINRSSHD